MANRVAKLELFEEEVQGILNVLGELPTKTGAYPLAIKIKEQFEKQFPDAKPESMVEDVKISTK
jgi:hypothetical protein